MPAPSKPYLTDKYDPTDPVLWDKVLQVARGDLRYFTRVGPDGPRTINAPNHGRGFRHWPNPKAVAWAIKQYNGYGSGWKGDKVGNANRITGWIGITVPHEAAQLLANIDVPGTKEPPNKLHTTMIYMGESSLDEFCQAIEAVYGVAGSTQPFSLRTNLVTCFDKGDDGYPIICQVESLALHAFRAKVADALDAKNVRFSKKFPEYKPHVSLAFSDEPINNLELPTLEWGAYSVTMWLGHNGQKLAVEIPFTFEGKVANGEGRSVVGSDIAEMISTFRVAWRYRHPG